MMKNKCFRKKAAGLSAVLMVLSVSVSNQSRMAFPGMLITAAAEETYETFAEEEGLLIEDSGEEEVDKTGADLEELKEAERREAEAAAQAESEAKAMAEAIAAAQFQLETADSVILQQHLDKLTEIDSPIGSDGELICAAYIEELMEQYGFTISEQNFHEGFINENGVDAPGLNIIAERGADADPEVRTNDIFIIAAHYDSKTNPAEEDPFANDKTGVAVLLEMARILSYVETDSDICFVFFSGEEDGLYGSANFVDFMQEDYAHRVAGVLYVELVGYAPDYAYLLKTWDGKENDIGNLVKASELAAAMIEAEEGSGEEKSDGENWIWAEDAETTQYSFVQGGMPAVTVSQDVLGEYEARQEAAGKTKESSEIETEAVIEAEEAVQEAVAIDIEKLADITDILAASVAEVMG